MLLDDVLLVKRPVLVVDDQEINREILGMILEDSFEVKFATNGREALDYVRREGNRLSVILLDLVMPVMDGYEVIRELKKDPELSHIPIIVLTAETTAELETLQLGASAFITKPFEEDEVIVARVARIVELSETKRLIRATEKDELTGLYNESFFFEYANQLQEYQPDTPKDAMAIEIDRFRMLLELYGRDFMNQLLARLGEKVREACALHGGIAGRVDENLIYVFVDHNDQYDHTFREITADLEGMKENLHIDIHAGICTMDDEGMGLHMKFARATDACSMLAGQSRRSIQIYDEEMNQREIYNNTLLADLPKALEEDQFQVYYQPKVDILGDKPVMVAAEALVRWKHPVYGMISPGLFIPLFEKNGRIHQVDYYVWGQVARQIRIWKDQFGTAIPVSVNLSRVNIHEIDLEEKLVGLITDNGLNPEDLHLEVTESAYTDDASLLIDVIRRLRARGFKIEMDDFGSGYSSLNMLSSMPIDVLKMDMQFVRNLQNADSHDYRMVQIILEIARFLGVPVVAEGAEKEGQIALLRNAGCQMIQGYFFSKPVPAQEFERFLTNREKGWVSE